MSLIELNKKAVKVTRTSEAYDLKRPLTVRVRQRHFDSVHLESTQGTVGIVVYGDECQKLSHLYSGNKKGDFATILIV